MCAYRLKLHFSAWRHCQKSTNDESAVLSSVSSFTRVCAYDRPGDADPPLPELPTIVLSAGKSWQPAAVDAQRKAADSAQVTFSNWLAVQDLLAACLNAKHIKDTKSGHNVYLYEPQLVIDSIREVVEAVRSGSRQLAR
jgi:pimeloyl-ACP methyl ester carboxylesterase